ncbi:ankyrin unc44 [Colletotrichum graminicola]|nr:ankyrin unc44 [Colletotrichum graminicola]
MLRGAIWDRPFEFSRGVTGLHIMAATGAADLANWIADSPRAVLRRNGPLHDWPDIDGFYSLHYACLSPGVSNEACSSQPFSTDSSRLVSSLARLGAIVNTKDKKQAAHRLAMETCRLGSLVERWWVDPNRSQSDWLYCIKYWERDMKDSEFAPDEPAAFAAAKGLHLMSHAIRHLGNEPGAGAVFA